MRLSKLLSLISTITLFSLLYVYQQTEIVRLAYAAQKKQVFCQDLLDKNSFLRYNIQRNASLVELGSRISKGTDFQMPDNYRLVRLAPASGRLPSREQPPRATQTLLSRLFGIKRQAEAETINR